MKVITYLMEVILSVPDEGYYVPDEGYYVPDEGYYVPDEGYYVPDEGYYVPDEGYSRKSSCTLKLYIYVFIDFSVFCIFIYMLLHLITNPRSFNTIIAELLVKYQVKGFFFLHQTAH